MTRESRPPDDQTVAHLDRLARVVATVAIDAREDHARLLRDCSAIVWESTAATEFSLRASAHLADLVRGADAAEEAARVLSLHSQHVAEVRSDAARAVQAVSELLR